MRSPTRIFWLTLALLAALGAGAASLDWPSPENLARNRLLYAAILVNALDKGFDPAPARTAQDPDAAYAELKARFGGRAATAPAIVMADARHERRTRNAARDAAGLCLTAFGSALAGAFLARTLAIHRKPARS